MQGSVAGTTKGAVTLKGLRATHVRDGCVCPGEDGAGPANGGDVQDQIRAGLLFSPQVADAACRGRVSGRNLAGVVG